MRIGYLLFLLFATPAAMLAQVGIGVEAGGGVATMKFAPAQYPIPYSTSSASPVAALKAGALVDAPINKHVTLQAGVYIAGNGAVRSFSYYINDSFNENVRQTLRLYYLSVPVTLLYKWGIQGKGRVIVGIGAEAGYLAGGTDKLDDHFINAGVDNSGNGTYSIIQTKTVRRFDIGLALTAGYELPTGWFARVMYTDGTQDIGQGTEIDKNRRVTLSIGYMFGHGRDINKDKEANDLIDRTPEK